MTNAAKIEITNCLDCPNHSVINDKDPSDWFCDDDVAVTCGLVKNPRFDPTSKFRADRQDRRCVTSACRPYNTRKESEVPEWCPLS